MLNKVITGIAQKLNQVFGDGYEVYIDSVKQGLNEPCFLITFLKGNQKQLVGNLYSREQPFDILYFPQAKDSTSEINNVIALLQMELEYITIDTDLLRGTDISHETVDGVLHFFVNYDLRVRREIIPDEYMGTMTQIERVKM